MTKEQELNKALDDLERSIRRFRVALFWFAVVAAAYAGLVLGTLLASL